MRLKNLTAVVAGGAGGIGRACVDMFLTEGARVASLDSRPRDAPADGCRAFQCDVSSLPQVRSAAAAIFDKVGSPDILVHTAGVAGFHDTLSTTEEEFRHIMGVNVWGAINLAQAFVPGMCEKRYGSVAFISSITGITGAPGLAVYSASKGALISLTRTMALEVAESGVRVNCVCPASVDTPMLRGSFDRSPDPAKARELNIRRHPLGRLGTPEDIARLITFLVSDEASWITGGTYLIDGGASIARRWQ